MADSEEKVDITIPEVFKAPPGSTEMIVKRKGSLKKVLKDEKSGKFVRAPRRIPEAKEVTRILRQLLMTPQRTKDGKLEANAATRLRKMFDNLVDIATSSDWKSVDVFNKDGDVVGTTPDAKLAMASIKAFEVLLARGFGKVTPSEEEMEALKKSGGIKVVVLQPPPALPQLEAKDEKAKPSFIDAEIVETNEG